MKKCLINRFYNLKKGFIKSYIRLLICSFAKCNEYTQIDSKLVEKYF